MSMAWKSKEKSVRKFRPIRSQSNREEKILQRYITLLRGINVGGKNKISMPALKAGFETLNFQDVVTYINSGNIIFSTENNDPKALSDQIKTMIKNHFDLEITVFTILQAELSEILANAPTWWQNTDKKNYDNLVFLIPPVTLAEFYQAVGGLNEDLEQAADYRDAIFWSYVRKDYRKSNWWSKTANKKIKDQITIRTANTVRKIVTL